VTDSDAPANGGAARARVLADRGVRFLFTLCGGHIAPILVECKRQGVRVVDVRHEATAAFAADAVARLTGVPGVAAVTAGPGVTNTVTAIQNARLAQSPLVLLGGATATVLRGRGALQDIDQLTLLRPLVKWATRVERVRDLAPVLARALDVAAAGVPGPVFVEVPVDLLYDEAVVRSWYGAKSGAGAAGLAERAQRAYLEWHLGRVFGRGGGGSATPPPRALVPEPRAQDVAAAAQRLAAAQRPVAVVGSQAMLHAVPAPRLAAALERLGVPVYLSGMARGLLGARHPLLLRHQRKQALREADLVLLAGVPCDFRLDYGRQISRRAFLVGANRRPGEMRTNRRADLAAVGDPALFLERLGEAAGDAAGAAGGSRWAAWLDTLRARDGEREADIERRAGEEPAGGGVHPLRLLRALDAQLGDDAVLVGDGGDFVATASYTVAPRGPLRWLDPGVFGTLGVGAGFAIAAALCRPQAEVWLLWGDGAAGFGLAELDTCVRHGLRVIAVVGNDAGWTQIAREQVEILGDAVGTELLPTDYDRVAEGFGAAGLRVDGGDDLAAALRRARHLAAAGRPVLVNARLGRSDFRKGSISM
jgi:acetolactate synthase-1/2/3 large subunit